MHSTVREPGGERVCRDRRLRNVTRVPFQQGAGRLLRPRFVGPEFAQVLGFQPLVNARGKTGVPLAETTGRVAA